MLAYLFGKIAAAKFSLRWSLLFIVLSAVFGVWRTAHFLSIMTLMPDIIAWALSVCVEIALIAAAGLKGAAEVGEYLQRMLNKHSSSARTKLRNARSAFWAAFSLVLVVAVYDSWIEYGFWFAGIAMFFQFVQLFFIRHYLLEHVIDGMMAIDKKLNLTVKRSSQQRTCPCCGRAYSATNYSRHVKGCTGP